MSLSPRFEVTVWPPFGLGRVEQSYHVRDNETGSEVVGRWGTRADAQAHADRCNAPARRCPCGHPLDRDGDPDQYGCLNGRIYGPCGDPCCNGVCDDTAGVCQGADGCCDPRRNDA